MFDFIWFSYVLKISGFQRVVKIPPSYFPVLFKTIEIEDEFGPIFQKYQDSTPFQKHSILLENVFDLIGVTSVLMISGFQRLIKIPPPYFPLYSRRSRLEIVLDPPGFLNLIFPKYQDALPVQTFSICFENMFRFSRIY